MKMSGQGWAIWFVGLPGSGKTTLARGVYEYLQVQGHDVTLLQMDKRRKIYFPSPEYTVQERERAYALFVDEAADLTRQGKAVLMDGSAYRVEMRQYARQSIACFAEIFVQCELGEAMRREAARPKGEIVADMYAKALQRQKTGEQFEGLGDVIGVDIEFEVDPRAELIIDNTLLTKEETLRKALHFLDTWLHSD
ncbi:adenylyl-sulfate kinase [uncultured Pseudodesulfovibrio sp.]|uniref:adenylyl-sulfate kinase n=1 Tax=uncultured Pseudodesulfovibrio sp. TaxID=2035858 RepID=UPI0029C6089C|nr:adenylyl-sulfate kinase [uncultured Pseudodesulfovibrio sp.]